MNRVIKLDHISKSFGRHKALDDVSLEVPSGVVCALLGQNGAGKTTAIRILLGLLEADSGEAEVLGRSSKREGDQIRRMIGYVPDRPTLYEWMTVGEIGWFAAGIFGGHFLERYRDLAKMYQLPEDRKIKALSKGMRAKVSLALACANDPQVLVLDEPTSGLDPVVRREFLESMVDQAGQGKTVLLSSHQMNEVERVADMIAIIRDGKLVMFEEMEQIKNRMLDVTVTLRNGSMPAIGFDVVSRRLDNRQIRLLVKDAEEGKLDSLLMHESVSNVTSRRPSLEDIYLATVGATNEEGAVQS